MLFVCTDIMYSRNYTFSFAAAKFTAGIILFIYSGKVYI